MDRSRLLSLKRRIATAKTFELSEISEELASLDSPVPQELLNALAHRIETGNDIVPRTIALLVAASRNQQLYSAARDHLLKDTMALITLFQAEIPDPKIEKSLLDELYRIFRSSENPWRSEILRALESWGSTDCIEDLEAIQYDFKPGLQTAKLSLEIGATTEQFEAGVAPDILLRTITHASDIAFGQKLHLTIQHIRERGKLPNHDWASTALSNDPFLLSKLHIKRAEQHISGQDYGASLNYSRKALEALLKAVIKTKGLKVIKDLPIDKLELPPLIAAINSQIELPKDIRIAIEAVQRDSTFGSHDQGVAQEEVLTPAIAQATIDKYCQIAIHFGKIIADMA